MVLELVQLGMTMLMVPAEVQRPSSQETEAATLPLQSMKLMVPAFPLPWMMPGDSLSAWRSEICGVPPVWRSAR